MTPFCAALFHTPSNHRIGKHRATTAGWKAAQGPVACILHFLLTFLLHPLRPSWVTRCGLCLLMNKIRYNTNKRCYIASSSVWGSSGSPAWLYFLMSRVNGIDWVAFVSFLNNAIGFYAVWEAGIFSLSLSSLTVGCFRRLICCRTLLRVAFDFSWIKQYAIQLDFPGLD